MKRKGSLPKSLRNVAFFVLAPLLDCLGIVEYVSLPMRDNKQYSKMGNKNEIKAQTGHSKAQQGEKTEL